MVQNRNYKILSLYYLSKRDRDKNIK